MKKKEKSIWRTPNVTARSHRAFLPSLSNVPNQLTPSSAITHRAEPFVFDPFPTFSFSVQYQPPGLWGERGDQARPLTQNLSSWNRWPPTLSFKWWQRKKKERERKGRRRKREGKGILLDIDEREAKEENGRRLEPCCSARRGALLSVKI